MTIKLRCINPECKYSYKISYGEFLEYGQYHTNCLICKSKMEVENLNEIIKIDIYNKAENYLKKWFNELGIEATIELVERNNKQSCYRIYKEILEKKGFKLK